VNTSTSLTRRHLIGGLGVAGVATATGIGVSGAAAPDGVDKDDEPMSPAPPSVGITPRDLANPIVQTLSGADFIPDRSGGLEWVNPGFGGVVVTQATASFRAGLRLPVGAVVTGAKIVLNPNGAPQTFSLRRTRAIPPGSESVATATSSSGSAPEAVPLAVTHTTEAAWTYRLEVFLFAGGPTLYGAEVSYTIPPDPTAPTGYFVPWTGVPRVHDSRTGAGKLAANEERVIALGVPGTVKAAVFNLTATETQTAGFVACFRADIAWPGNSSINWYETGANVANVVVCPVDPDGSIKIRGGNDSTHVVIDLVGTYA
jgi:hypothetical protein